MELAGDEQFSGHASLIDNHDELLQPVSPKKRMVEKEKDDDEEYQYDMF